MQSHCTVLVACPATIHVLVEMCECFLQTIHVQSGNTMMERSTQSLSGGEKRRVAIALVLGFAELIGTRAQLSCNVAVFDEVRHMHSSGVANFLYLLQK